MRKRSIFWSFVWKNEHFILSYLTFYVSRFKEKKMDHKQLDAWKEGVKLVKEIYLLTRSFPKEELYGLTNQLRRAAVSIPSNIAEGSARQSDKEMIQFLYVALGSLSEVETQIIIAIELEYISNNEEINGNITKIRKLIVGLIKYLKGKGK